MIKNLHPKQFNYLKKALDANKLHHAYIFHGPTGGGKFLFALNLARFIQCESRGDLPCEKCNNCKVSKDGFIIGTYILDKGKNERILIDEVRDLQKSIGLSGGGQNKKIFIINNIQNLSNDSQETLLKTLEEPSPNSLIILISDEKKKIPKTILSRCPDIFFSKPKIDFVEGFIEKKVPKYVFDLYSRDLGFLKEIKSEDIDSIKNEYESIIKDLDIVLSDSFYDKMNLAREMSLEKEPIEKVEKWISVLYNLLLIKMDLLGSDDSQLNYLEKKINYDKIIKVLESFLKLLDNLNINLSKKVLFEDFFLNI